MSLSLAFSFDADYAVEQLPERCAEEAVLTFAGSRPLSGPSAVHHGVGPFCITVFPRNGNSWTGRFAPGGGTLEGIYATPSPTTLCVIVGGEGYWIDVLQPGTFEMVRSFPIAEAIEAPTEGMILFLDHSRIAAYGATGFVWTKEVSWDGITSGNITGGRLHGQAWDAPKNKSVPFSIGIATGELEGGSNRARYAN